MRYAIFSDIHANLEALEAVLNKIDELAQEEPIDQIWFLGDLVGYGPNPNECIAKLRERTDVIIAGNHDWAAIGKIDLEDFSEAARISAEWTAKQLTEQHHEFLTNLPEHLEIGECTLVHGSPYGPLWEYLTSEVLAERSFQYFTSRYCLVGHTHVPLIYQQPDSLASAPTTPLENSDQSTDPAANSIDTEKLADHDDIDDDDETVEMAAVRPTLQNSQAATETSRIAKDISAPPPSRDDASTAPPTDAANDVQGTPTAAEDVPGSGGERIDRSDKSENTEAIHEEDAENAPDPAAAEEDASETEHKEAEDGEETRGATPEEVITNAEERLNQEIEELLTLLGLSQSMIQVTNEMIIPPEGNWQPPEGYRAIINPGGVGQPRDGDPRAAFMIYDTERGFTFYRVPYDIEKTQEKIIKAGLPQYLATRLAYGR